MGYKFGDTASFGYEVSLVRGYYELIISILENQIKVYEISPTDLWVLAFIKCYEGKFRSEAKRQKLFKHSNSINNALTKLKSLKLIYGEGANYSLVKEFDELIVDPKDSLTITKNYKLRTNYDFDRIRYKSGEEYKDG
jgi:hypothetical protein